MKDLRNLTDAFAELERRGDEAADRMPAGLPVRPNRKSRLVPVAVAVAVVAGLATGVALLAPGDGGGTRVAAAPSTSVAPPTSPPAVPTTPEDLANRFRTVLGDTATFVVTDTGAAMDLPAGQPDGQAPPPSANTEEGSPLTPPEPTMGATSIEAPVGTSNGAAIVGTLTAGGVTGGFDLQIYQQDPGTPPMCDNSDDASCSITENPTMAVGSSPLANAPDGVTHMVQLIRDDGVTLLMHVSNERDPKGESEVLAPQPPLTTDQMIAILTSDRW
jgi:hypothetical protein